VLRHLEDNTDAWRCWFQGGEERRGKQRAGVAQAHTVARGAWGRLAREERDRPALAKAGETCRNPRGNHTMASRVNDWLRLERRTRFRPAKERRERLCQGSIFLPIACEDHCSVMAPQVRPALADPGHGRDPLAVTKMVRRKSRRCPQGQAQQSAP
jgi:hypothetical protein